MAIPITIPRLGWNMEKGIFIAWLKQDGAQVKAGEPVFTLESEKSTEDIESLDDGILRISPDGPKPGDEVLVGAVIGYFLQPGEATPESAALVSAAQPAQTKTENSQVPSRPPRSASAEQAVSPRARRLARERGIDWTKLQGSGRTGRIRERDIAACAPEPARPSLSPHGTVMPLTSVRKTIAERMLASHQSTAPVTLTTTADATNLVNLRNQFKAANDLVPTYTDFLLKLTAVALQKHPPLNATWTEDGIVLAAGIHIGIAVDTDTGLLAPVIRDVPSLGLKQVAQQTRDLVERARLGKLSASEMQGGTFTVTNLGSFGVDAFTPIINLPECAILGVGRIERRPAVLNDQVVIRDQITLSLTFDHRLVDGAPAARFLQTLAGLIENPSPWLMA